MAGVLTANKIKKQLLKFCYDADYIGMQAVAEWKKKYCFTESGKPGAGWPRLTDKTIRRKMEDDFCPEENIYKMNCRTGGLRDSIHAERHGDDSVIVYEHHAGDTAITELKSMRDFIKWGKEEKEVFQKAAVAAFKERLYIYADQLKKEYNR